MMPTHSSEEARLLGKKDMAKELVRGCYVVGYGGALYILLTGDEQLILTTTTRATVGLTLSTLIVKISKKVDRRRAQQLLNQLYAQLNLEQANNLLKRAGKPPLTLEELNEIRRQAGQPPLEG